MSIKKLFDAANKTTQYSDYNTEKDSYSAVESSNNAISLLEQQRTFVPHVDYSNPEEFALYGSAELYYKGAFDYISDFYPYDGSLAEQNAFYNKLLPVEKYVFNKRYPRTTGYAILAANPNSGTDVGWGTRASTDNGYGLPSLVEHITFKGGPHTGSHGSSLKEQVPNELSSKLDRSNIYDENIYETAGLPTDYGKGTRLSNLHADFDTGVTVEFWLNTGSLSTSLTEKQVIFDWWNQEAASSNSYGRILVELTSSTNRNGAAQKPFIVTVMSGATTTRNFISLGSSNLHYEMSDWKHYAISMVNSGSLFKTKLYVNGKLDDESRRAYDLTAAFRSYNSSTVTSSYSSEESLQGWWRLNDLNALKWPDSSGNGRDGSCDGADCATVSTSLRPHLYISPSGSATFDGSNDHVDIGTAALWNGIIGNADGSTQKMTLGAWIYKTDTGSGLDRILDFANTDIGLFTDDDEKISFVAKWGTGTSFTWSSANSVIPLNTWTHVMVTYDATGTANNPILYINGDVVAWNTTPASRSGLSYYGIVGPAGTECYIGDSEAGTGPFKGNIADAAIWNTTLTEAEIKAIYSATVMPAKITAQIADLNNKSAIGRIGALQTAPVGTSAAAGAGKLSGSMDEFRFWKIERNAGQIAENYFDRVGGGSNTDISNTTLGVYFKFNEGITGVSATDSVVSDYSGRISNGVWTGYKAQSRNTGSAILSASAAISEFEDPIIRSSHPSYTSVREDLVSKGEYYDSTNHSAFVNHAPSWVIESHQDLDNNNLSIISHIVGSYFDNVHLLTKELPKFKQVNYVHETGSVTPFANHLPQSLGLYVPDIFVDASVQEILLNRNDTRLFENNLFETKNLIYQNLYNNLANIYKAKGTETALKNVLRCFNVDDDLVQLKIYSDNNIYEVKNNLRQITSINKSANFNNATQTDAVVYQRKDASNQDSRGFISGSAAQGYGGAENEKYYGFTAEADIIFPKFFNSKDLINRNFTQVSLFGVVGLAHPASTAHQQGTNTSTPRTGSASRLANFQVYAIRDEGRSKNVYFKLESSGSANPFPTLTSSLFKNVYDNNRWNVSVRLKPKTVGLSGLVSGSTSQGYDLIFRGSNSNLGVVQNSFEVSSSVSLATGSNFLVNHKRVYAGAYRNNLTGTLVHNSDVKVSNIKYWAKSLENSDLELHMFDINNSGISGSYKNISALDTSTAMVDNLNKDTLVLEWNYDSLTGSDASGNFVTQDFSSGSSVIRENYGWLGRLTGHQYNGYGNFFNASSTQAVSRERVNSFKFVDPEEVVSSEMISILDDDDELLGFEQTIPNYVITAEKSMYRAISEEMLIFFSGIVDFNNTIGEPVNRYRGRYKNLEKLREAFFRRVQETKDIEKFINYYKWFDSAITEIFSQLVPASANFVEGVTNMVESHVLERNKYKTPFPTLESKQPEPEAAIFGIGEKNYPYDTGFTTLPTSPRKTNRRVDYWKRRAERSAVEISSGDATIDSQRDTFRDVINSRPVLSSSRDNIIVSNGSTRYTPKKYANRNFQQSEIFRTDLPNARTIKGGTNFSADKNIQFSKAALHVGGPVNQAGGVFVPQNILLSFASDFLSITDFKDPSKTPSKKIKRIVPVDYGRHHDDRNGYYHVKSSKAFPFNIISSSLNSGYQSEVQSGLPGLNVEITNLHNDVYGDDQEVPLQGIFTKHNVGGNQHRHIPLNTGADNNNNRPEAWRILLGACDDNGANDGLSGAVGMVGADYPMSPDYIAPAGANQPYPHAIYPRATHYRDMVAKRPVNLKNIRITGSTKLGNYTNTYEVVSTFGAFSNPRQFVENVPVLPTNVFQGAATSSTSVRTFLDTKPTRDYDTVDREHFSFVDEYNVAYLTGTTNKSVIKTKFSAPGGIEVMTPGYTDFRSDEFSVYNALNYKNLSVIKPSQGPSGTISETYGIRVSDIHAKDYGLRSHLARHTARFGRDSLHVVTTPGATYDELPGFHKVHRNNLKRVVSSSTGVPQNDNKYDNYFVQHQIPRSSKQYAWITASLVSDNGHVGFTPTGFQISSSAGYIDAYNFITASQVGSLKSGGVRRFGLTVGTEYLPQVSDLNLNIYEPLTSSTNTLGQGTTHIIDYINNADALIKAAAVSLSPNAFNNLMFKRGNQYGFPSWKQTRQAQHPIIREQRKENKLQIMVDQAPRTFKMQPVSVRQKLQEIGVQSLSGQRHKLKTTHHPEYFGTTELNNRLIPVTANDRMTPLQAVIVASYQTPSIKNIDYIKYAESSFPASRNEFLSHSTQRLNYSNGYWHSNREQRNIIGAELYTGTYFTQVTGAYVRTSALGYKVSASAWHLDAPTHFLTRQGPCTTSKNTAAVQAKFGDSPHRNYDWLGTGSAGELQNDWQSFFIDSRKYPAAATGVRTYFSRDIHRAYNAVASPLYARKHLLSSPLSIINPNSITNTLAGRNGVAEDSKASRLGFSEPAGPAATPFLVASASEIYAGEALWEAADNALVITDVLENYENTGRTRYRGQFTPTAPAYDSYAKFVDSIKLQSRGKAIVPEYRISRNLPSYLNNGNPFSSGKQDYFDIPGCAISSSQQDFYIDYSNSDFLKYFAEVSNDSGLKPAELRLVCSASIKFHPYKGFFPSQRTVDLVSEFKNSYENHARVKVKNPLQPGSDAYSGKNVFTVVPGAFRPVMQAYFAPGILFNSIKSGMAVDYPILYNRYKMMVGSHYTNTSYTASTGDYADTTTNCGPYVPVMSDYMICTRTEPFITASASSSLEKGAIAANRLDRGFGSFWDERIPFEAIIDPNMMANTPFADCEAHPSATINTVATYEPSSDSTYTLMAKNFFGGVAEFYLKDSQFTSLKSETVYKDDYRFESGSVYMARIKMRRSVTGSRDYSFESGSFMPESYTQGGGTALLPRLATGPNDTLAIMYDQGSYFELPQDPMYAPNFNETFTMYSRPSSFGPPVAGHHGNLTSSHAYYGAVSKGITPASAYTGSAHRSGSNDTYQIMDSIKGYNWSFTPPYYHGEAWADLVFRPQADTVYDLERILAETAVNYWRVDPGPKLKTYGITYTANGLLSQIGGSGSIGGGTGFKPSYGYIADQDFTSLIHDPKYAGQGEVQNTAPYAGSSINGNAMQLSASLNLFGVERVFKETTSRVPQVRGGASQETTNEVVGKRWIISTKFETPMLNFNDKFQPQPVTSSVNANIGNLLINKRNSTKTLPTFGSSSAPNGMWHQFGQIPQDSKTGVFIEIEDMPKNWLRNHYQVRLSGSIYNNGAPDYAGILAKEGQVGSLRDLCGFKKTNTNARVGELKESHTISEAIVAIPYVVDSTSENLKDSETFSNFDGKYLFRLPSTTEVNSNAAIAINKQKQIMNKYIVPPQFDFINYPKDAAPVVMYFFEFSYTFDKDDLSFMWQNLMPRNHEKGLFKTATAEHRLDTGYPLEASDILQNSNMRWMVFKVKQRSQADYYDYVSKQAGTIDVRDDDSPLQFNWPYDFCSIIESINMDTEVLFNNRPETSGPNSTVKYNGSISSDPGAPPAFSFSSMQAQSLAVMPNGQSISGGSSGTQASSAAAQTVGSSGATTQNSNTGAPAGTYGGNIGGNY